MTSTDPLAECVDNWFATAIEQNMAPTHQAAAETQLLWATEDLAKQNNELRAQVAALRDALERSEIKLSAYRGVCSGDKELTKTILPMLSRILSDTAAAATAHDARVWNAAIDAFMKEANKDCFDSDTFPPTSLITAGTVIHVYEKLKREITQ